MITTAFKALSIVLLTIGNAPRIQPPSTISGVTVCEVITRGKAYEGKDITLEGELTASMESVVLSGGDCGAIFVSGSPEQDSLGRTYEETILSMAGGLRRSPVHVRLEGLYHGHLSLHGMKAIRQFEIRRVLLVSDLNARTGS
jgi:hypothetical protein